MAESRKDPRIVAFLCHWCTYTGADLAGTTRQQYPSGIRILHLMCSGAIDVVYVLKALLDGADGVLIGGCHPGDCHYHTGNLKARRRIALLRNVMETLGLDQDRVWLRWISASEGNLFAETVRSFNSALEARGDNLLAGEWDV